MLFVHCLSVKMREYSIPLMFYKQQKRETLSVNLELQKEQLGKPCSLCGLVSVRVAGLPGLSDISGCHAVSSVKLVSCN